MRKKLKQFHLLLPESWIKILKSQCDKEEKSLSEYIREIISKQIKKLEKKDG